MPETPQFLVVNRKIRIPLDEIRFAFIRSGGPGGQNVNKVSTKAQMHWNVRESERLPDEVKQRFLKKYARRINNRGEVVVVSQRYRTRSRNMTDCLEKLGNMLSTAAAVPAARKPTAPSKAARRRRLDQKRKRSQRKELRRPPQTEG